MSKGRVFSISPTWSRKQLEAYISGQMARTETAILNRLIRVGENFITNARSMNTYKDQTGNLRSSIGYLIFKDGEQLAENFPGVTAKGQQAARTAADLLKRKYTKGFVLIGVAGMEYAAAVESKGFDVITGSGLVAAEELKRSMKELQEKLNRKN